MSIKQGYDHDAIVLGLNINALGTIRSLASKGVPIVAIDAKPLNYRQIHSWMSSRTRLCKKVFYPRFHDEESIFHSLMDYGKNMDREGVLIPSNDLQLMCISNHRDELKKYFKYIIPDKETVDMLNNKVLFYKYAQVNDIDIPRTFFSKEIDIEKIAETIQYPCLIKPYIRDNNWQKLFGDTKVIIENDAGSLIKRYNEVANLHDDLIIQEVMTGNDNLLFFSFTFFNNESKPLTIFTGRKIRQLPINYGTSSMAESIWDENIAKSTISILEKIKFVGYGSIEYKKDVRDGIFKVMEITTGRTWYPHALSTACGINIPYIWYQYVCGKEVKNFNTYEDGVRWIDEFRDLLSGYQYYREGELSLKNWCSSYSGKLSFATFSISDPMPFLFFLFRIIIGVGNSIKSVLKNILTLNK